jgi:hypothetical protein
MVNFKIYDLNQSSTLLIYLPISLQHDLRRGYFRDAFYWLARNNLTSVGRSPVLLLLASMTYVELKSMEVEVVELLENRCGIFVRKFCDYFKHFCV